MRTATIVLGLLGIAFASSCDRGSTDEGPAGTVRQSQLAGLPNLGKVPPFSLQNERGRRFGTEELSTKPYLAAFMFTRCPTVCPRLTKRMVEVKQALDAAGRDVQFVSISVDPEYDTPTALAAYKQTHGAKFDDWHFLTGDFQMIAKTAEEGFKIALSGRADETKEHYGITHGSHLILVDAEGQIRGYFRSTDEDVAAQLLEATTQLD